MAAATPPCARKPAIALIFALQLLLASTLCSHALAPFAVHAHTLLQLVGSALPSVQVQLEPAARFSPFLDLNCVLTHEPDAHVSNFTRVAHTTCARLTRALGGAVTSHLHVQLEPLDLIPASHLRLNLTSSRFHLPLHSLPTLNCPSTPQRFTPVAPRASRSSVQVVMHVPSTSTTPLVFQALGGGYSPHVCGVARRCSCVLLLNERDVDDDVILRIASGIRLEAQQGEHPATHAIIADTVDDPPMDAHDVHMMACSEEGRCDLDPYVPPLKLCAMLLPAFAPLLMPALAAIGAAATRRKGVRAYFGWCAARRGRSKQEEA